MCIEDGISFSIATKPRLVRHAPAIALMVEPSHRGGTGVVLRGGNYGVDFTGRKALAMAPKRLLKVMRLRAWDGHVGPHRARKTPPTRGRLVTVVGRRPSGRLDEGRVDRASRHQQDITE